MEIFHTMNINVPNGVGAPYLTLNKVECFDNIVRPAQVLQHNLIHVQPLQHFPVWHIQYTNIIFVDDKLSNVHDDAVFIQQWTDFHIHIHTFENVTTTFFVGKTTFPICTELKQYSSVVEFWPTGYEF